MQSFNVVYSKLFCLLLADEYDAYIIVSFVNATLVLSIGETVEEVTDSGFLGTTPTLSCSQLGDDALVQVSCVSAALLQLNNHCIQIFISTAEALVHQIELFR